jgi:hypothetical protein
MYFFVCSLSFTLFCFYIFYVSSVFFLSFLAPVPFVNFFPTVFILMFIYISLQLCNLDSLISVFRRCGYKRDIYSSGMLRTIDWLLVRPTNRCFGTTYRSYFKGQTVQEEFNCSWMWRFVVGWLRVYPEVSTYWSVFIFKTEESKQTAWPCSWRHNDFSKCPEMHSCTSQTSCIRSSAAGRTRLSQARDVSLFKTSCPFVATSVEGTPSSIATAACRRPLLPASFHCSPSTAIVGLSINARTSAETAPALGRGRFLNL